MKKLVCATIILILASVFTFVHPVIAAGAEAKFGDNPVYTDFKNGVYGDEVYYLSVTSPWGDLDDVAIFKRDGEACIVLLQSYGRIKTRKLTGSEIKTFESYITENKVDQWRDLWPATEIEDITDATENTYTHFSKNSQAMFNLASVDPIGIKNGYLSRKFKNLAETGNFNVYYDLGEKGYLNEPAKPENGRILIKSEDRYIETVWKNGDDFRVLVKDPKSDYKKDILEWFRFKDGVIGEKTTEPEGFTMQNAWDDIVPYGIGKSDNDNNGNKYPWQVQWKSYLVRARWNDSPEYEGIILTGNGEESGRIIEGYYSSPVVIPGTDWVVCADGSNGGWGEPNSLVRINLSTSKKSTIKLPPADTLMPVVFINGRMLIYRRENDKYNSTSPREYYWYDAESDTVKPAEGDFYYLSSFCGRFLQPTSNPGKYYASGGSTVGIYDTKTYKLTNETETNLYIEDYDHMWVDEENGVVYIAVNGDLVELPIKIAG